MVDTVLPQARPKVAYILQRLTEPAAIRPLLEPQRAYAAYALGQLEPSLFPRSQWWQAQGPTGQALVLHAQGGLGPAFLALGDAQALEAILRLHPGARLSFATFQVEHLAVMKRHFLLSRQQLMVRMVVTPDSFQGAAGSAPSTLRLRSGQAGSGQAPSTLRLRSGQASSGQAVRLRGRDVGRINRLYSAEGGPSSYRAADIEAGVYYGVVEEGRLVAIAGTHVVAPGEGVAVVGNVFTHPRYRGRGFGSIATGAVTAELLERLPAGRHGCPLVALTAEANNEAALHLYRKLGYRDEGHLYETPVVRKDPIGLLSLGRRLLARFRRRRTRLWRGRGQGTEVVVR